MPTDRSGEPWPGATYKGFSGAPPAAPSTAAPPPAPPRRGSLRTPALVAAGVGAALALGLGFGFWARPELGPRPAVSPAASAAAGQHAQAPPGAAQVPIAVNPPPGTAPAATGGRLETLPPEMTAATQAPGRARPQAAASRSDDADSDDADDSSAPPATPATAAAPAQAQAQPQGQAQAQAQAQAATATPMLHASFDCATARPGAEQMVCSDPALAAEDLRLARAYRRAARSGVDPDDLREEQHDWVGIREDAARHSHIAVAQVYEQRIQELNRMADAADDGSDDEDDGE